jgi:predicted porin
LNAERFSDHSEEKFMQKKLIAAAVAGLLAAPAFAQSNVTISGLVKAGYEDYKLTNVAGFNSEERISDQASRIIFAGNEDLGGGLKAFFQLDARFSTDLGALAGTGNTGVGLMGGWGKLTLGRWDIHYNEFGAIESNRAGSLQSFAGPGIMSQVNGTSITTVSRTANLAKFDTANLGGFTATVAASTSPRASEGSGANNGSDGQAWNVAARYAAGPLVVGASYYDEDSEGATSNAADQKGMRAWAGYTFPMGLKVGLGWDRSENRVANGEGFTKRNAWFVPVSYTMGAHGLYLTYARAGNLSGPNGGATTTDTGATQWMLGYDYALSKRTSVGAYYTKLNNKPNAGYDFFGLGANGATATAAGNDARQIYIGMAHSFSSTLRVF